MKATIKFQKYTQAGTDDYTTIEATDATQLASALVNILTNRKKGFPREVMDVTGSGDNVTIVIATHVTQVKPRSKKSSVDITME